MRRLLIPRKTFFFIQEELMANVAINRDFVSVVADELTFGFDNAVECWMAKIEQCLTDSRLTTMGRLNAVRKVLEEYKLLTGKARLGCRREVQP
jgi:hypothetical protein